MRVSDLRLLAGPGGADFRERASVLFTGEALVLDLGGVPDQEMVADAVANLRALAAPTVLVGDPDSFPHALVGAVDVCVREGDDLDAIEETTRRQPIAAMSLVALLRAAEPLGLWSALVAESSTYALLLASGGYQRWLAARPAPATKPSEGPAVEVERDGDVLRVTLNRPEARNAIDTATRDALVEALHLAAADESLRVELRGKGPSFSAGGDLGEFGTVEDAGTAHAVRLTRHPGEAMAAVAERTTVFVHGACVGAGIEIPAFAGTIVAEPDSTFRLPEVTMGLIPGAGGTVSIPRRIGRHRTAWMALTARAIDVDTALAWGLVDR
jgi:enoyl-CoA hydratase